MQKKGRYSLMLLGEASSASSLLYDTTFSDEFEFDMALNNKTYAAYDHFYGSGVHCKTQTKKEPIRML